MAGLLFKFFLIPMISFSLASKINHHPIFISVTEIEHNAKDNLLEVSCKIFTDDFEKTLRSAYKTHVDLQDDKIKPAMNKLVNDYVQKHLKINIDGKIITLNFIGYEIVEEGVYSYYQADKISSIKKITVMDNILFEYKAEQISLLHINVGGKRQSTKLNSPETTASMIF